MHRHRATEDIIREMNEARARWEVVRQICEMEDLKLRMLEKEYAEMKKQEDTRLPHHSCECSCTALEHTRIPYSNEGSVRLYHRYDSGRTMQVCGQCVCLMLSDGWSTIDPRQEV